MATPRLKFYQPLFASVFFLLSACSDGKKGIKPSLGTLTESVYASVSLKPENMYDVYPASSGILQEIFVQEGDLVRAGQVIAKIKADNPSVLRDNAKLNESLARENYLGQSNMLETMQEEIKSMQVQLHLDSLNFKRLERLWNQKIGTKSELEIAELRYQNNSTNLSILKGRYEQTQNELRNRYRQAQNSLKQAQTSLGDYTINSIIDGKVYAVLKEAGEQISMQQAFAQIGDSAHFTIEMSIDEEDIASIRVGQKVFVTLDAYQGQAFEALVTRIIPIKDERTHTFNVEALFSQSPEVLYAGLSGEANIMIRSKANVITIPLELLSEQSTVMTSDGEVKVQTGLRNLDRIEIVTGIDTATAIYPQE